MEMRCEKCGSKMNHRILGSTQGLFCENCGWNVVTTYLSPIQRDTATYQVFVHITGRPTIDQIRCISKIANRNFLEVRQMLTEPQVPIYKGNAVSVLKMTKELEKQGFTYEILPPFPYCDFFMAFP